MEGVRKNFIFWSFSMPEYTSDDLREQLLTPLTRIISDLSEGLVEMESLKKEGKLPNGKLALRAIGAVSTIKVLRKFKRELADKLEAAEDGTLDELEQKRIYMRKRRATNAPRKKNKT